MNSQFHSKSNVNLKNSIQHSLLMLGTKSISSDVEGGVDTPVDSPSIFVFQDVRVRYGADCAAIRKHSYRYADRTDCCDIMNILTALIINMKRYRLQNSDGLGERKNLL